MNSSTASPDLESSYRETRWALGTIAIACVLFLSTIAMADPDLWGHTYYGLRALDQGVLVERTDPFSYTASGAPWINHEWLSETIFAVLWKNLGSTGLVLWRNLLVCLLFTVFWSALRSSRAGIAGGLLLLVFTTETLADFVIFIRPQLATFVLFAGTLLLLRRYWDRPSRAVWWCVPMMALWTNMHGGFLSGVGITCLFAAAGMARAIQNPHWRPAALELLGLSICVCGVTLINPYGTGLHAMLWEHLGTKQFIREWQPLWKTQQSLVYYVPFGLSLFALWRSRRWQTIDLLILIVVGWQAASHLRHVALLAISVAILLPAATSDSLKNTFVLLTQQWSQSSFRRVRVAALSLVVLLLVGLRIFGSYSLWKDGIMPWQIAVETRSHVPGMPVRAMRVVKRLGLTGNLVTDYGWGQFAIWHFYPQCRVAFDGRYRTVFPKALEEEFLAFQRADGDRHQADAMTLLNRYHSQIALLPVDSGPERCLSSLNDWVELYRDDQAALFVRRGPLMDRLNVQHGEHHQDSPAVARWTKFPGEQASGTRVALFQQINRDRFTESTDLTVGILSMD